MSYKTCSSSAGYVKIVFVRQLNKGTSWTFQPFIIFIDLLYLNFSAHLIKSFYVFQIAAVGVQVLDVTRVYGKSS